MTVDPAALSPPHTQQLPRKKDSQVLLVVHADEQQAAAWVDPQAAEAAQRGFEHHGCCCALRSCNGCKRGALRGCFAACDQTGRDGASLTGNTTAKAGRLFRARRTTLSGGTLLLRLLLVQLRLLLCASVLCVRSARGKSRFCCALVVVHHCCTTAPLCCAALHLVCLRRQLAGPLRPWMR
jgi:hypothetical protein